MTAARDASVERTWELALGKVERLAARIGDGLPHLTEGGRYDDPEPWRWTSGFWPGLLWHAWRATGRDRLAEQARRAEDRIWASLVGEQFSQFHHDLGFQFTLTAVARYRLTGAPEARRRALHAAQLLAGRFNPAGRFLRAWNRDEQMGGAIVDTCLNLPLLFWAARESGDPRFRLIAEAHLGTVLRHFVRPDGSCYHILLFDPDSGLLQEALAGQGAAPESAWSRGQAWALYGLALAFRWTGRPEYQAAARRVAEFFLADLPADDVPRWDFRAPGGAAEPRDSSAGAIAACGLLELARQLGDAEHAWARSAAVRLLSALDATCTAWHEPREEGILLHGVSNLPNQIGVDTSLIYGDLFFVEALARLRDAETEIFWA